MLWGASIHSFTHKTPGIAEGREKIKGQGEQSTKQTINLQDDFDI